MKVVQTILDQYKDREINLLDETMVDLLSLLDTEQYIKFCEWHPEFDAEFWVSKDAKLKRQMIDTIAKYIEYSPMV